MNKSELYYALYAEVCEAEAKAASLRAAISRVDLHVGKEKRDAQELQWMHSADVYRRSARTFRSIAEGRA